MAIGIDTIEYYLPKGYLTSDELASNFGFSLSFVEEKIGVKRVYIADKNENTSDLAVASVRKLIDRSPALKDQLGVLVVCTQTPDFQLPHTSAIVQNKLGLGNHVACFDLGLGCSGFVYGLSVVRSFMEENHLEYGLLITAEKYSGITDCNDRNTKALFSDSAAATLMSRSSCLTPMRFTFGTNGDGYDKLILRYRGSSDGLEASHLHMDGRGIFEFVASVIPADIRRCLEINGMALSDIDSFVFHQASNFMLDTLARKLDIPCDGRVMKCIDRFGNTVSSSIPIALKTLLEGSEAPYRNVLISGFGVGLSWASTILKR